MTTTEWSPEQSAEPQIEDVNNYLCSIGEDSILDIDRCGSSLDYYANGRLGNSVGDLVAHNNQGDPVAHNNQGDRCGDSMGDGYMAGQR